MILPIFEQILIQPEETTKTTQGGIFVPNTLDKGQEIVKGEVVAKGFETKYVEVGDKVFYDRYVARKIKLEGDKKLHSINWKEIIAIEK